MNTDTKIGGAPTQGGVSAPPALRKLSGIARPRALATFLQPPPLLVSHAPAPPAVLRIVVADDSVVVRRHLVEMLGEIAEVDVVAEAGDTPSALASAAELRPDVVVLDLQMPGDSGLVALRRLRTLLPDTRVIILTNHANPFYRRKCMDEGASFFFDKSVEFEKVGDVVRSLAAGGAA